MSALLSVCLLGLLGLGLRRFGTRWAVGGVVLGAGLLWVPIPTLIVGVAGSLLLLRRRLGNRRTRAEAADADVTLLAEMTLLGLNAGLTFPQALESAAAHVEDSVLAAELTDPEGPVQRGFGALLGDRVMQTILVLEDLVGQRSVAFGASDAAVSLPGVGDGLVRPSDDAAREVFDAVNEERVAAGAEPLTWSEALSGVATGYAEEMYRTGRLAHRSDISGSLEDRLRAADISTVRHAENLALGATTAGVHDAVVASPPHRANLVLADIDRVGVGVVSGPFGLMTVQIFAG